MGHAELDGKLQYVVSDINVSTVERLNGGTTSETFAPIPPSTEIQGADIINPGDVLQITIYEIGISLFTGSSPKSAAAATEFSADSERLPNVVVDDAGTIELPYVGRVEVAGRSLRTAEQLIENQLVGKSQSPQVMITLANSPRNSAYILGDVRQPGRVPLTPAGEKLLDALTAVGGTVVRPYDAIVRLTRGPIEQSVRLSNIRPSSPSNLLLLPGDRIEVLYKPLTFIVLGSSSRIAEIPFEAEQITLAQALGKFGGLNDNQADPRAIFMFRQEVAESSSGVPTIYRLNMMDPSSYFVAQNVYVRDKDLIYVASAKANIPTKFVAILNQLFSPVVTARALSR